MQKRSHKLLASTLLRNAHGFRARRFELAFLFGSFQPDCNPLSYLKGSLHARKLRGHNFSNSQPYIFKQIQKLQRCEHWTIWQYYTLGKLTHYLADAFTYPHNDHYCHSLMEHRRYENELRLYLRNYLRSRSLQREQRRRDLTHVLEELHQQYVTASSGMYRDAQYILKATSLLMAGCLPSSCLGKIV